MLLSFPAEYPHTRLLLTVPIDQSPRRDRNLHALERLESESRDGVFEIVASSGAGIRATVAVQNAAAATTTRIAAFNPLAASFNRGVFVARLPGTGDAADRWRGDREGFGSSPESTQASRDLPESICSGSKCG